jgi:pimeloyl-ACP methyl ester carboxylesterase
MSTGGLGRTAALSLSLLLSLGSGSPGKEDRPPASGAKPEGTSLELKTKTGSLHGTLDLPTGKGPFPVVLMIAGSGPTDRDGNQPRMRNDSLKMLGKGLAAQGVAVLRYDRRGIGASAAAQRKEADMRFDMLIADAVEWIKLLRKDGRFTRVGVVGHSEGALVGLLAAKRAKADAYVSVAGAGRSAPEVLREQLGKNLPRDLKAKADPIIDAIVAGRPVADVPKELAALFRPSVQAYLTSYFKYDPAKEIATAGVPVLIVQGTTDVQISMEDAKRLAKARKGARLVVIKDMNHVLKLATTTEEQRKAYFDPSVKLAPRLVPEVAAFLRESLGKTR